MSRNPLLIGLALVGVALLLTSGIIPAAAGGGVDCGPERATKVDVEKAVFFAVLEGMYRDGVDSDSAKLLASTDEASGAPLYFIYSCPLCTPAFNAVRTYATRPVFHGDKQQRDTFGPGLSDEVRANIASDEPQVRLDAFQGLIQRWMASYLDRMRLTPEERRIWAGHIQDMREKGNGILGSYLDQEGPYQRVYRGWKKCAVCEGSSEGSM